MSVPPGRGRHILFLDLARDSWGAEESLYVLAASLMTLGHQCTLVAWAPSLATEWERRRLGAVVLVSAPPEHQPRADLWALWASRRALPAADAVVIFSLDLLPAVPLLRGLRRFRRAAFALDLHDNLSGVRGRWLLRTLSHAVDVVVAVSSFTAAQVTSSRVVVLHRPGAPISPPPPPPTSEVPLMVGIVGRIDPSKGHVLALEAVSRTQHTVQLVVRGAPAYGEPDYLRQLQARARVDGVDVDFQGRVPASRALEGLHAVLVTNAEEPMGRTVVEGQLNGLAVIVPDRGGAAELVAHRVTGWRYRAGDARSLAVVLDEVAADQDRRTLVAMAGQRSATLRHEPTAYARGYADALSSTCGWARPMAERDSYAVLHVVNSAETGGAQTLLELLAARRRPGQIMRLVVLAGPGELSPRLSKAFDSVDHLHFDRRSWAVPRLVRAVGSAIRSRQPDVVHTHLLHADLAVALQRLPGVATVSTVHTTGMSGEDPWRSRVLGRIMGAAARRFDAVVACDSACLSWTGTMGYPARRVGVIGNGVLVGATAVRNDPGPVLLSLARWHPMKDHRTLFLAVRRLADRGLTVRLRCAGSGMEPSDAELRRLLTETGVTGLVELLGPRDDVASLLVGARALVISSAYGEAMPMAGLEALAQGRPVVSTDVGGCPQLAVDDNLLVPSRDPGRLADALAHVLTLSEPSWAGLCDAALLRASTDFDIDTTVRRYDELYRTVLERKAQDNPTRMSP